MLRRDLAIKTVDEELAPARRPKLAPDRSLVKR
jgi:hypothetical protein